MGARLLIERESVGDRCANCAWWVGRHSTASMAHCQQHGIKTLDLAKCSDHRADQGGIEGDIIEG